MADYPRSGSLIDPTRTATHTGLSTNILIKVDGVNVGALQEMRVTIRRNIERVKEIGLDGILEAVPNQPTEFQLDVTRIVFDGLRLPEAFARAFRNIQHQRIPFNIEVFDFGAVTDTDDPNVDLTTFHNCWFNQYSFPFTVRDYIITEQATIISEFVSNQPTLNKGLRGIPLSTDARGIEATAAREKRRGSLDVEGIVLATRTTI